MKFLIATAAAVALLQETADVSQLQPQKEGFTWVYQSAAGEAHQKIVGRQKVGDAECIVIETSRPKGQPLKKYISVGSEGVLVHRVESPLGPADYDPPMPCFKAGTKRGDSWEYKGKIGTKGKPGALEVATTFTNEGIEEIKVPAGKFKAWKIVTSTKIGADLQTGSQWYAADVGLVREDISLLMNGQKVESSNELKSYEQPK